MRTVPSDVPVPILGPAFERRQTPQSDPWWQDSVVLCWWDAGNRIGGFHRIGHQPNLPDGPSVELSTNLFLADRVLKRCEQLPLREEDRRPDGFGCGDGSVRFAFTDHAIWRFAGEDVSGELHVRNVHDPVDIYPKRGDVGERIAAGHLEAAGRVTGELTVEGRRFAVDGAAIRDHGWGVRHWDEILVHRWLAVSFGEDATVYAVSILTRSGQLADFGCVVRGDELAYADDLEIVTFLERDGVSHRGGTLRMRLATGEVVVLEAEPIQKGVVSWMARRAAINDTICRFTWGDRVGYGDFETSNNPCAGATEPPVGLQAFVRDGLHHVRP